MHENIYARVRPAVSRFSRGFQNQPISEHVDGPGSEDLVVGARIFGVHADVASPGLVLAAGVMEFLWGLL